MSDLAPNIAPDIVTACQAGAEEAVGALNRSLDGEFSLTVGEASTYSSESAPSGFDGAGLAVLFQYGDVGAAVILPESSKLLPAWYAEPDPTGVSKLSTLSQELSMLLMPESLMAEAFEAGHVVQISEALTAASVADDAALVPLELTSGDTSGQLSLIWPLNSPTTLLAKADPAEASTEEPSQSRADEPSDEPSQATTETPPAHTMAPRRRINNVSDLPSYSRSLLKISTPVRVVLASRKETVQEILTIATGTIIKFEKGCEEPLELLVGDEPIATGDAIKVGDKFGFRVSEMLMPSEHFMTVRNRKADGQSPESDAKAS